VASPKSPTFALDHTGIVVEDLDDAISFYEQAFGMRVLTREADTDVDPDAIGLPGEPVRLRGAILTLGDRLLELHQYLTPTGVGHRRQSDQGIGHIAFAVDDIHLAWASLRKRGVTFNSEPKLITSGELSGRWWVYGRDPWGVVVELCQHPKAAA
jgi:catechol 2,3-dioxygenase-like lactoylglutathione lyase family enzyme